MYRNKKTRGNYRTSLRKFLRFLTADAPDTGDLTAETYLADCKDKRNPAGDLMRFANTLAETLV